MQLTDITQLLSAIERGEPNSKSELFEFVYADLRQLASGLMSNESSGHSMQPTALVNETYLRLFGVRANQSPNANARFENRRHFFGAAAEAMRRILIESARKKSRSKNGGQFKRIAIEPGNLAEPEMSDELLALDESLSRLNEIHPEIAELVRLRFFAGLTSREAAQQIGVSPRKADSQWAYARAWLLADMRCET